MKNLGECGFKAPQERSARRRIADIEADPSIGRTEKELDEYLKRRGVKV